MSEPPDLDALARRFLDLWERQAAELLADPSLAAAMAPWLRAGGAAGEPGESGPPGAEAAAAPSRLRDDDVAELARRLVDCEKRIAALESRVEGGGKKARSGARKRGS